MEDAFTDSEASRQAIANGASIALNYLRAHQGIALGFLHDAYDRGHRTLTRVETGANVADIFTKPLGAMQHHYLRGKLTGYR